MTARFAAAAFPTPLGARNIGARVTPFAPFIASVLIVLAGGLSGPAPAHPVWFALGVAVWLAVGAIATVVPWRSLSLGGQLVPAILHLLGTAAVRHGLGGSESGYAPIALIPIIWLALYGSRRQMLAGVSMLALVLVAPIVLVGGEMYPASEWRRVIALLIVAAFAGLSINALVSEVRRQTARLREGSRQLADQVAVTRAVIEAADDAVVSFDDRGRLASWNAAAAAMLGLTDRSAQGADVFDTIVAPDERPRIRAGLTRLVGRLADLDAAASIDKLAESRFETVLMRSDGSTLPVEVTVGVTGVAGGRLIHAFARDISTRVEEEEASRAHLGDLDRLLAVARDLGRPGSAGDGRDAICHAARELAGADSALFFEIRPNEGMLVATGTSRSADDGRLPARVTLDITHSLTARILVSSEPTFVGDLQRDARVDHETAAQLGVRAAYWQPVTRDGLAIGVLVVYWRQPQPEVSARIRSILELFATQAAVVVERSDLMSRLESLARTDPLTGLANRRALDEALVRDLAAAERTARPLSVVMLDLDHFKRYNDTRGHQAGDALLHDAAGAWARELRASDTVARYGGEEFLVVLPACDAAGAAVIADRLREMVPGDETASAGVAAWNGTETMASLIARADAALYEAKRRGRDRTELAAAPAPVPGASAVASASRAGRRKGLRIAG